MKTYVLGGGCFWCLDAVYQMTLGVESVVSGYSGGALPNPNYDQICTGMTGHAEVVTVTFDETVIPAETILDMFFIQHDPTTLNRQGYDTGTQYRSVTEVTRLGTVYDAEQYHNDFYGERPEVGYCRVIIDPKIAKVRKHYAKWLTA